MIDAIHHNGDTKDHYTAIYRDGLGWVFGGEVSPACAAWLLDVMMRHDLTPNQLLAQMLAAWAVAFHEPLPEESEL